MASNIDSLIVQRALGSHTKNVNLSTERLATGFRVNRPSDDAAAYIYSEKLDAQVRGMDAAQRNINDGIATLDTADTSLTTVLDNLQRIREIVVEANGGGQTAAELDAGQIEINNLVQEISDLRTTTEFNGRRLLDGTFNQNIQNGPNNGNTYALDFSTAGWNRMNLGVASSTTIGDLGYYAAADTSTKALNMISVSTGVASLGGATTGVAATDLDRLDRLIRNASSMQASTSARRNRLSSDYNFLTDQKFNYESAKSNVMDADIALESTRLTINQVLQQSAVSLLAQANSSPQLALSLIP